MIRQVIVAACVLASAVLLSGCVSNIAGTASAPAGREPWITPLGEDDLDSVLLDVDELDDVVGATSLEVAKDETDMADTSDTVSNQECLGAFNGAEEQVYRDSDWTAVRNVVANEPDADDRHWVQQVLVLFPSSGEAEAFFAKSEKEWKGCNQQTLDTYSDDDTYEWRLDDVKIDDSLMSQFGEQTDMDNWGCDHSMAVVSNVIIEAVICARGGPEAKPLAEALVANVGKK